MLIVERDCSSPIAIIAFNSSGSVIYFSAAWHHQYVTAFIQIEDSDFALVFFRARGLHLTTIIKAGVVSFDSFCYQLVRYHDGLPYRFNRIGDCRFRHLNRCR
ncbi:hypothetical protein EMGBS15_15780 [Filimonas sp.]|nr:hypothetical protein EMGBS15_15780 [Filimonas sp.]